ncbi:MAG: T9SS type A sorting domain-containing protein [Candidatus Onthomorpha sp.]|nr:T9SS type A sorting domain-containing protein [Candidatus Onthomorpha sp.]
MKRAILILSFVFASLAVQSVMAQNTIVVSEDTLVIPYYDTVVVFHHPDFESCNKTVWNYRIPDNHFADGTMEDYYSMLIQATKSEVTVFNPIWNDYVTYSPRDLAGSFFGKNSYAVEAYGQPFHFDSLVTIIGIAAQVRGHIYGVDKKIYITTEENNFEPLTYALVFPAELRPGNTRDSRANYFFEKPITIQDFIVVGETYFNISDTSKRYMGETPMPAPWLNYNATFSVFDTVWNDTIFGCQNSESPWLKQGGQWRRFCDDTVYYFAQNSTLNFNPIVVMPSTSGLSEAELASTCSIYPNPANNEAVVLSNFRVEAVEIYDMSGRMVRREEVSAYELHLDLQSLASGSYVFKIKTIKGTIEKKVVKQ